MYGASFWKSFVKQSHMNWLKLLGITKGEWEILLPWNFVKNAIEHIEDNPLQTKLLVSYESYLRKICSREGISTLPWRVGYRKFFKKNLLSNYAIVGVLPSLPPSLTGWVVLAGNHTPQPILDPSFFFWGGGCLKIIPQQSATNTRYEKYIL